MVPAPHAHLAFATNYRRGMPDNPILRCRQEAMRRACADFGAEPAEFNGQDNHAHLRITYPPKTAIPAQVNSPKAAPARRLRAQFTSQVNKNSIHGHSWSPSYFAASCGGAPLTILSQHIQQQNQPG